MESQELRVILQAMLGRMDMVIAQLRQMNELLALDIEPEDDEEEGDDPGNRIIPDDEELEEERIQSTSSAQLKTDTA